MDILFGLLASIFAVSNETLFRTFAGSARPWWYWPLALANAVGIGICIHNIMIRSSSLLSGIIVFTCINYSMRVVVTLLVLGETVLLNTWVAFLLMVSAIFVEKLWR